MKILVFSPNYLPLVGGLESTVDGIACALHSHGCNIRIVTLTPANEELERPFPIYRNPSALALLRLFKWSEVVYFPNMSLKGFWPLAFFRRPIFVSNHISYHNLDGSINFLERIKLRLMRFTHVAACSMFVLREIGLQGVVIHSPYNHFLFRQIEGILRKDDLVFLGRLVSDKGVILLLQALELLRSEGLTPHLTIIGDGEERDVLEKYTYDNQLTRQVTFKGTMKGIDLVQELNRHKVLIAPSIWDEPFGKVALEGLACGCNVVVTNSGGFPEAAGPTGILFEKNNIKDLAQKIKISLQKENNSERKLIEDHLRKNNLEAIGKEYFSWIYTIYKKISN